MLNFRSKFKTEISNLRKELDQISPAIKEMKKLGTDDDIQVGSKVICTYKNGNTVNGRVIWIESPDTIWVNRDKHTTLWNFRKKDLKNLSVGTYGVLERRIWQIENRMNSIKADLKNAIFPQILEEDGKHYIEIVEILKNNDIPFKNEKYDTVTFLHSNTDESYQITLPRNTINSTGFFQIKLRNSDIIEILKSSERVYIEMKKKN